MGAFTFIVYVQDHAGWKVGFGVPAILMFLSALSFFIASPIYIKQKATMSLFTNFARVIVVCIKNRKVALPSGESNLRFLVFLFWTLKSLFIIGMCMLEMATLEIPYRECDSIAKIYKKVIAGVKPQALNKVSDLELKAFIEKCIGQARERPTAVDLIKDPFLSEVDCDEEELPISKF
ncbi:hypothetical protein RHMOL_Rhmol12G0214200 [Rhododendron molle]|uniref:Uncharacterized protein n=1 Tax=Rhododendron molle TaxID=49168 RepID=A0ACC0LL38_RHOML|nr:hypothetical protein RHMOL_Rhmol12G0214200 [Rhododendron molle]